MSCNKQTFNSFQFVLFPEKKLWSYKDSKVLLQMSWEENVALERARKKKDKISQKI
jgi:hypothetical protein